MKILKFEGATMREALGRVKAELGDQAVVVATRQIRKGLLGSAYEISAAIDTDDAPPPSPLPRPGAFRAASQPLTPAPAPLERRAPPPDVDKLIAPMRAELRSLRAMIRAADNNRGTTELRGELAGLRKMVENLGRTAKAETAVTEVARATVLAAPSTAAVVALVGPTGVGKTTTIAKIAARAALVDTRRVALITLDSYRVGGVDQIRTFAELIGVPLAVARHPAELADHVDSFAEYDLILVDTAGRSPRDASAIDELGRALAEVAQLEVHLTLAASSSAAAIDDLHARYAALRPSRLLFTKLDETDAVPELVRAPTRLALPITWLAVGQAVPEVLEEATAQRLTELASNGLHRAAAA